MVSYIIISMQFLIISFETEKFWVFVWFGTKGLVLKQTKYFGKFSCQIIPSWYVIELLLHMAAIFFLEQLLFGTAFVAGIYIF